MFEPLNARGKQSYEQLFAMSKSDSESKCTDDMRHDNLLISVLKI
jgi:hypothetical protein